MGKESSLPLISPMSSLHCTCHSPLFFTLKRCIQWNGIYSITTSFRVWFWKLASISSQIWKKEVEMCRNWAVLQPFPAVTVQCSVMRIQELNGCCGSFKCRIVTLCSPQYNKPLWNSQTAYCTAQLTAGIICVPAYTWRSPWGQCSGRPWFPSAARWFVSERGTCHEPAVQVICALLVRFRTSQGKAKLL